MTFVKSHSEALARYYPVYAGAHRVNGLQLPVDRTYVVNDGTPLGTIREAVFRQWGWAPGFLRNLKPHKPEVVHAHFGTCGPAGLALAEALQVPLVVTFHGQDATMDRDEALRTHRGRELLNKKNQMIKTAGIFIAVSGYIRQRLIEQGYPEEKVVLHRNGIDLDFFKPSNDTARKPIILFVGRFVEKKGVPYLIEAARQMHDAGVDFELVMIGTGPLESELKNAAASTNIPCHFAGFLSIQEVRQWLGETTVVAVPSVTAANGDSEGLPTILLEAQAMETPVVATRHSGMPEGVREGVTAELVEERDAAALAQKLRSFLESPAKGREFGRAGRLFVTDNFDIHTQVKGLEDIYADLYARQMAHSKTAA